MLGQKRVGGRPGAAARDRWPGMAERRGFAAVGYAAAVMRTLTSGARRQRSISPPSWISVQEQHDDPYRLEETMTTLTAITETASVEAPVHRWRAFAVLAISYFMTVVDLTIVNVALPTIGSDLHFSETNLQWVVTAYGLTFGGFLLLGGRAADLLGRRRIMMLGLAIFTAASLACALATTDTFLIAMRGVQGVGAAVVLPAALSIVMNMFNEGADRNKALGAWGAIAASGATVGLIAGGLLTRYIGWQYIFFLNVPIGVLALLLAPRIVPESRLNTARRSYDPLGGITVTGGLLLLVYAFSQAPAHGWTSGRTVSLLAAAAALEVAFVWIETRVEAPLLPLRLFRSRTVAAFCWAAASSPSSSSAPSTCSRCCTTRRSRPASPGSSPRSPRSRLPASRRRWSRASPSSSCSPQA